jgi:hypothetical protein
MSHELVPTFDQLAADPTQASRLSLSVLSALQAQCAAAQARYAATQSAIAAAIFDRAYQATAERSQQGTSDRTLDADQIAEALGRNRRWVFRNAKRLPFVRRITRKALSCSEAALLRWREAQRC